ncbi:hypothetical protein F900_02102 [Acinetobacter modestus]|uniref:Uncharacterized protein n=1 Tax=Acinetobacter modestus TaxID=1776740 RepID=N9N4B9_9GAMM|nr:hypothetical protein [Acinetobacter modestus]ENX00431.1 hypothetical protein F900_02102 [Acinetobacter modestus]
MRPCSRTVKHSGNLLQDIGFGLNNTLANIRGTTKKLGAQYKDAMVLLYSKSNLHPVSVQKPDEKGNYAFLGLNNTTRFFIVAFDINRQYNAVIQDNVGAK